MKSIKFKTAKEMVNWLMDNEGKELCDGFGRKWKYERFRFYFRNIGTHSEYQKGIHCLHLYNTALFH